MSYNSKETIPFSQGFWAKKLKDFYPVPKNKILDYEGLFVLGEGMLTTLLAGILVAVSFFNLYWGFGYGLNSDMLHLPLMYNDWISGKLNWFFYSLPPSRFIFPDIPLYFILRGIIGHGIAALVANVWLNYLLLATLLILNARIWFRLPVRTVLIPVLLSLTIFTLPNIFSWGIVMGLFWPTAHSGAVLVSLIAFACLGRYLLRGRGHIALLVSSFFLGFTEPLCFILGMLPMLAVIFFSRTPALKRRLILIASIFALVMAGSWLGDRLMPTAWMQYLHTTIPSFDWLLLHAQMFLRDMLHPKVIPAMLILAWGTVCAYLLFRHKKISRTFLIGFLCVSFLPLMAMLANGRYMDIESARYFALCILLPLVAIFAWLWQRARWARFLTYAGFAFLLVPFAAAPTTVDWRTINYPPFVQKLDSLKDRYHLQTGLGGYWTAKQVRYFSRQGMVMNILEEDASTFLKLGSLGWLGLRFTPLPLLQYNYILIKNVPQPNGTVKSDLNRDWLLLRFGPPSDIQNFQSDGETYVLWIYNYDLGIMLERDRQLWSLLSQRLTHYSYFLSDKEFKHVVANILGVTRECEALEKQIQAEESRKK